MTILKFIAAALIIVDVCFVYGCLKMSSLCSRDEEKRILEEKRNL